jgi:hypothetical protein
MAIKIPLFTRRPALYQELTELSLYFKILEDSKVRAQFGNNAKTRCKDLFNTTINITALQEMYERYFCRNQRLPKIENQSR